MTKFSTGNSVYDNMYTGKPSKDIFLYSKLSQQLSRLEKKVDKLETDNRALKRENTILRHENQQLREENTRLKNIINTNSKNSSKPPSTDQKSSKAPNEYNSRKQTNKRPGGQLGRSGITLTSQVIDRAIQERHIQPRTSLDHQTTKYVVDLEVNVIAHTNANYKGGVIYGPLLRALAIDLYSEGAISFDRIQSFLNNLSGGQLQLSVGAVYNFVRNFALECHDNLNTIKTNLLETEVLYTDSTNVSVNGIQSYIRNHSTTQSVVYSSMPKKNLTALKEYSLLSTFTKTLVHDHETAIYHFGEHHAECNAHLMRYLRKNTEETSNSWSGKMSSFLIALNQYRMRLQAQGVHNFTSEELDRYSKRYDTIIALGKEQNKTTRPRFAMREERSLLARLEKYKVAQLYFLHDFAVDFTNNLSERDLRKCKTKQKVSGGFRKLSGQQIYCNIMSIVETCKKRHLNVLDSIIRIQAGELVMGE